MSVPPGERLPARRVASHLGVMVVVAAVMGVVVAGLAIPFAGVLGIGAKSLSHSVEDLPGQAPARSRSPSRPRSSTPSATPIATLYDQNRINVPLSQISRNMVKSIVAIEDYRFYQHGALDLKGTLRALVTNQASGGVGAGWLVDHPADGQDDAARPGQDAKERKAATADTYARKINELRYAIAFEQNYSKDWILERYLNIAYFGDGAYGVQAAARHYFGTNAKDLTLLQGATLAGLVKNPSGYDPITNPDRGIAAPQRRARPDGPAQRDPAAQGRQAQEAAARPAPRPRRPTAASTPVRRSSATTSSATSSRTPHSARRSQARKKLLYTGGLTIHTTISLRDQRAADNAVRTTSFAKRPGDRCPGDGPARHRRREGDLPVAADGSRQEAAGQTFLNYVVPQKYGDSNGFQPGSTFKAFVLAAAIQQGIPLSTADQVADVDEHPDEPVPRLRRPALREHRHLVRAQLHDHRQHERLHRHPGVGEHVLRPARAADRRSASPTSWPRRWAIDLTDPATEMVPSFTLGVASVSPLELADAYATFAARGLHCDPRPVISIDDSNGNQLQELRAAVPAGDRGTRRRRRQRRAPRRDVAERASARA